MNSVTESKPDEASAAPGAGAADLIDVLRRFHYGEPGAAASTALPGSEILPALLNPYRDASAIRYQYPLYLAPPGSDGDLAKPLSEFFAESLEAFALGPDDARILRDNLPWIERYLRQKLEGPDPVDASALFADKVKKLRPRQKFVFLTVSGRSGPRRRVGSVRRSGSCPAGATRSRAR